MHVVFRSVSESRPGSAWRGVFRRGWPGWRAWYLSRGGGERPSLSRAKTALRRHMPELETLWESLVDTSAADPDAARFLTFWTPPRYLVNCSQAVLVDGDGPLLIRNYDLDPGLNEGTLYRTAWRGREVIGMVDGMAGLADGMNRAGLAISLTFGGRTVVGPGFGVPLILRYVLELCSDAEQAMEALRAVPCHMSYNVTVLDKSGASATLYLSPDRPPILTDRRATTNHQLGVEWPRHGRISNTLRRADFLDRLLAKRDLDSESLTRAFLAAPLFGTGYASGFGTVYTALYRPLAGTVQLLWPGSERQLWGFDDFPAREFSVAYSADGAQVLGRPDPPASERQDGDHHLAAMSRRNAVARDGAWDNLNAPLNRRPY